MEMEQKNAISHRARALENLRAYLQQAQQKCGVGVGLAQVNHKPGVLQLQNQVSPKGKKYTEL
jgi:hypothetical protein